MDVLIELMKNFQFPIKSCSSSLLESTFPHRFNNVIYYRYQVYTILAHRATFAQPRRPLRKARKILLGYYKRKIAPSPIRSLAFSVFAPRSHA